jgi:hypothetical protein
MYWSRTIESLTCLRLQTATGGYDHARLPTGACPSRLLRDRQEWQRPIATQALLHIAALYTEATNRSKCAEERRAVRRI